MNRFMLWLSEVFACMSSFCKSKVSSSYMTRDIKFIHRNSDGSYSKMEELPLGWTISMCVEDIVGDVV